MLSVQETQLLGNGMEDRSDSGKILGEQRSGLDLMMRFWQKDMRSG